MATNSLRPCRKCGKPFLRSRPDQNSQFYCSVACRLWSKVDASGGEDACWEWQGKSKHIAGYGLLNVDGKVKAAHRVVWELENAPIQNAKLFVCHTCDNPPCCNPRHLFLGTPKDNNRDMVEKGRHWSKGKILPEEFRAKLRVPKRKIAARYLKGPA